MPIDIESTIKAAMDEAVGDDPEGGVDVPIDEPIVDDAGGLDEPVADVVADTSADETGVAEPVVAAPIDEFAKEHGIPAKDKSGRENRIPYSRTVKITENAVKKARTTWEAETAPVKAENVAYRERLERIGQTEEIMFGEPERFLQILATSVPGYAKLLSKHAEEPKKPIPDTISEEPGPDVDMGNGQFGYSPAGLAKLRAYDREQAVLAAEERLSKRYKPLEDAFTSHQGTVRQNEHVNTQLDEGMKWPGFAENADAILKALTDDFAANPRQPKLRNLRDAYDAVVFPKLKTDEAAIETRLRAKILDEMKRAPRSTSTGHTTSTAAAHTSGSGDPIEDAIRASMKGVRG